MNIAARDTTELPLRSRMWLVALLLVCVAGGAALHLAIAAPAGRWLAWIALTPYGLVLRRRVPAHVAYSGSFAGIAVFHMLQLQPLSSVFNGLLAPAWFFATLLGAVVFLAVLWVWRHIPGTAELPLILSLPAVWIAYEVLRRWAFMLVDGNGLPFLDAGLSMVNDPHFVQVADVGGIFALSGFVAVINGALGDLACAVVRRSSGSGGRLRAAASLGTAAVVVGAVWLYGQWRLAQPRGPAGPVVALITGACPVGASRAALDRALPARRVFSPGQTRGANGKRCPSIDLYVWPEGSLGDVMADVPTDSIEEVASRREPRSGQLKSLAESLGEPFMAGAMRIPVGVNQERQQAAYNSLLYITPERGLTGIYDKQHVVSFLESEPGWLRRLGLPGLRVFGISASFTRKVVRGDAVGPFILEPTRAGRVVQHWSVGLLRRVLQ